MRIASAQQMRQLDQTAIRERGIPSDQLANTRQSNCGINTAPALGTFPLNSKNEFPFASAIACCSSGPEPAAIILIATPSFLSCFTA